jgi:threonine dehydrogenase-like Zn-dependent dehydrogenase
MSSHIPPAPGTIRALQTALTAEHAAIYGYGVVGAYLAGSMQAAATNDWVAHQVARDRLEAVLRSLGAQPTAAAVAYHLPVPVRSASEAVALAVVLEDRIATAYLGLVALSNVSIRVFGAMQVQASAMRAAAWRGGTVAFPGMTPAALAAPRQQS